MLLGERQSFEITRERLSIPCSVPIHEQTEHRRARADRCVHGRRNSLRATCRMTGFAKKTVGKLLVDMGCSAFQDRVLRNLSCKRIQCDEIWAFVGAKEKNASA